MKKTVGATKQSKNTKQHARFYRRKGFLWSVGSVIGVVLIVIVAFRVSPWPGALIIRKVFEDDGAKVKMAMQKYTPTGVAKLADQSYDVSDPDAKLDVYYPARQTFVAEHLPVVIWTHGGAWISGDKANAEPYFRLLASRGYAVVSVNYTLAPAKSYPTQIHQLNRAHKYIAENATKFHLDPNTIFFAGDSAGSQLSAEMAALITNPNYAREVGVTPSLKASQLKGVILNCGIYKMEGLTQPEPTLPKLVGWGNDVAVWSYAGTRDFSAPVIRQMSPYYHVTKAFPPIYITGGNGDPLTNAQSKPFADELQRMGVSVTRLFYPEEYKPSLPHEYQFHLDLAAAQKSYESTISFIESHTVR